MNEFSLTRSERIRMSIIKTSTYEKVELATGINITTLKRIASGKRDVYAKELEAIAEATKTDIDYLMFGENSTVSFKSRNGKAEDALALIARKIDRLSDDELIFLSKILTTD
ncbi:hypothetical protein OR604_18145 [Aeromonas caviae]|uniref:hypothetical protein n=1 Tax=Aeromonas caviae TaxID=648 RepID=UPI00224DE73F|nr:hypothetical protein [Aeromonas caviae]MCX4038107.1 hypothetical protein [Aeromonas caviae]